MVEQIVESLNRIKKRGNGYLFYVVKDGLVERAVEVQTEDFNDVALTIATIDAVLELGSIEHMVKMRKRKTRGAGKKINP